MSKRLYNLTYYVTYDISQVFDAFFLENTSSTFYDMPFHFVKLCNIFLIHDKKETVEDTGSEGPDIEKSTRRRRRYTKPLWSVVNPDENFYFYWLMVLTLCVLYNLWTLIVRQSFPELQVKYIHL